LIIAEATAVEPRGRISPGDAGLWHDGQIEPLARINRFIKAQGAVTGIQIAHAGRKASVSRPWEGDSSLSDAEGGWEPWGPSAEAFGEKLTRVPHEMTLAEIEHVKNQFVATTKRALAAGYDFLELHAAHGYLAHSFYSPLSNHRTDAYGGSFENRIRFTLETFAAMRAVWPERLPLAVRLSCTDWVEGGWTLDDSVELSRRLKALGADLIDCSSAAVVPKAQIAYGPGFQVPFAERIRREAGIATAAVGAITEPVQAEAIIAKGQADLVLLARAFLRDPYWPHHAARTLGIEDHFKTAPIQYGRAL
jgi:2,4-dienoyl-CoA reductase-like NADH-dependent reductase (Old Yellow Enzyme family)